MKELVEKQVAIDLLHEYFDGMLETDTICPKDLYGDFEALPSAQPEITDEQAIDHLQKSGWMQNHDKQMYEMGLKERLADDSGSYDALLPSVEPDLGENLYPYKCYITDREGVQHEVIHIGDIRRVTGWEI